MAVGCLTLGVVELLWPAGARRVTRPRAARAGRVAPAVPIPRRSASPPPISPARLIALVDRARAETDPERRTAALRVAILTIERWRAGNGGLDDGVGHALERARAEQWADYQRIALRRLANQNGGPRDGPPNPPTLGRAPGNPGRASVKAAPR